MNENLSNGVQHLEYNSLRSKLILPEYGRHFQKMIDKVRDIENREERNQAARYIIRLMGDLNPHLRDIPEFQHKLWDQLYTLANFNLDIDFPDGKIPNLEHMKIVPVNLPYPQQKPKYRFYGNNIKAMIDEAIRWEEGDKKDGLIFAIANHMKKCYLNWNNNEVKDSVIFDHLRELSNGEIDLQDSSDTLSSTDNLIKVTQKQSNKAEFNPNQNTTNTRTFNQNNNTNRRFTKSAHSNQGNSHSNQGKSNYSNNNKSNQNNRKA